MSINDVVNLALANEGQIFTHRKEQNILTSINLDELLQEQYESIHMDKKLRELVEMIMQSKKNIFAVHDQTNCSQALLN